MDMRSQTIGDRSSSVITMPEGSLYPTLYRLEREMHYLLQKAGGRTQNVFIITWSRWGKTAPHFGIRIQRRQ